MKLDPKHIIGRGGISAKVIEHSLHPTPGMKPLVTLQLRYPRFIHSEFMTHRVFSRNASSSRAIPVAKMLEQVRNDPAMPIHWGANQAGMQASKEHDEPVAIWNHRDGEASDYTIESAWGYAAGQAADVAEAMSKAGYHKQVVNRILEPFQFISVIVTATEWDNFFELRDHPDAQPEIQELARVMKRAFKVAPPKQLAHGDWHLPYVTKLERRYYSIESLRKLSAARCARVSYLTHDGQIPDASKDFDLFERLVGSAPLHASPIEHQATADVFNAGHAMGEWANRELWGNFQHWVQHRKIHERVLASPEPSIEEDDGETLIDVSTMTADFSAATF